MMSPLYEEYLDEALPSYVQEVHPEDIAPPKPTWIKWLLTTGLFTIITVLFIGVHSEHLFGVFFALINCVIACIAIVKLANKRSLCSVFVITFITLPITGWCLGTIYFAIFLPDTEMLNGSVKLQAVILLFMTIYLTGIFYILRHEKPYIHIAESRCRRLNSVVLLLLFFTFGSFAVTKIWQLPGGGIAGTLYGYSYCTLFVVGAQATYMRRKDKLFILVLFGLLFFFFTLANERRYAIVPMLCFLIGLFFLSHIQTKTKLLILLLFFLAFPTYLVIGNTVRYFVGKGGYEDLGKSMHALKGWKYAAEKAEWMDSMFLRLFYSGGHAIITETPDSIPYVGFSPVEYIRETLIAFIPEKFMDRKEFEAGAKYAGNYVLNNYGISKFYITRKHQTGVTLLGHLWTLGGYPFIIAGAIILVLLQGIVFKVINRAVIWKPERALFLTACLLLSAIEMVGFDLINIMRLLFWRVVLAIAFYYVFIAPFLKQPGAEEDIEETGYGGYEVGQ